MNKKKLGRDADVFLRQSVPVSVPSLVTTTTAANHHLLSAPNILLRHRHYHRKTRTKAANGEDLLLSVCPALCCVSSRVDVGEDAAALIRGAGVARGEGQTKGYRDSCGSVFVVVAYENNSGGNL